MTKIKQQAISGLTQALSNPATVVEREMKVAAYQGSPQGRIATPQTLAAITLLDDVKKWYADDYQLGGAFLVISGDVSVEQGKQLADKLLKGVRPNSNAGERQTTRRRSCAHRKENHPHRQPGRPAIRGPPCPTAGTTITTMRNTPATLAGQRFSSAGHRIAALNKYVRAEKGLTYGCREYFMPNRHIAANSPPRWIPIPDTTLEAIQAMIKVFNDMKTGEVTAGRIDASEKPHRRGDGDGDARRSSSRLAAAPNRFLNDYPIDYYDQYASHVAAVKPEQVKTVVSKFVKPNAMIYIVVAPAKVVKEQLDKLGTVEVRPMPLNRTATASKD